jgi:hypothetical protein
MLFKRGGLHGVEMVDDIVGRCRNAVVVQHLVDLGSVQDHLLQM